MALDHKFSNTGTASVGELLQSNEQFLVPRFQRNYSWDQEKVEKLWTDIEDAFEKFRDSDNPADAQYLLGPVVLVRNDDGPGKYWIIDGQQRLATLTMIFCVARDIISENMTEPKIEKIKDMIEISYMDQHKSWKLVLNDTDKYLFQEIQAYEEGVEPQIKRIKKQNNKAKSKKRLIENYVYLYEKMTESLCTNFGKIKISKEEFKNMPEEEKNRKIAENIPWLKAFLAHIRDNNYLVKIMVNDYNTASQIFETLNHRGAPLSKSSLVKNYVINQIKTDEKQIELSDRWNKIFDLVIGKEQDDDDFIIESFRSRDPMTKIPKKDLYKIIKENLPKNRENMTKDELKEEKEKACLEYIKKLEIDAEFISQLNDYTTYPDNETRDDIRAIDALGAKFIRIPIIAANRRWEFKSEYKTLVKFLVKFFFKYRVVGQNHPGEVDRVISNITQNILDGVDIKEIITSVKKEEDDHGEFKNHDFKKFIKEPIKSSVARYILQQITLHLGTEDNDVRPIDGLTLEHILPRKFKENWPEDDFLINSENKMEEYVNRLGNLTLLTNIKNITNRNNSFDQKKSIYEESNLDINRKTVVTYDKWTSNTIEDREAKFCEHADKIWNLDKF